MKTFRAPLIRLELPHKRIYFFPLLVFYCPLHLISALRMDALGQQITIGKIFSLHSKESEKRALYQIRAICGHEPLERLANRLHRRENVISVEWLIWDTAIPLNEP